MRMSPALLTLVLSAALLVPGAGLAAAKPSPASAAGIRTAGSSGSFAPTAGVDSPVRHAKGRPASAPAAATLQSGAGGGEPTPPPNDQCAGAISIPCGTFSFSGNTFYALNDYTFTDSLLSCTGYTEDGNDVVYKLEAQAGDSLWARYTSVADGAIYLVTDCGNVQGTCVAGVDAADPGQAETLRYGFPSSGTYYLILDSYGPATWGAWTLVGQFLSCGLSPPVNDRCETANAIFCGSFLYSGSTVTAFNDYHFPDVASSCFGATAGGRDVAYRLNVTAGDSLAVNYVSSADGVIYLLGDCGAPVGSCIAGSNTAGPGGMEMFEYRFIFTGVYYLILDSNGNDDSGNWSAQGELICAMPPPINDRCGGAGIYCGEIDLSGSTALAYNDYMLPDSPASCTGFATNGPDVAYRLDVSPGDSLWVDYQSTADGAIYLVTNCGNVVDSCVIGRDQSYTGGIERLRYKFTLRRTYYLILDSYDASVSGDWTLVGRRICGPGVGVEGPGTGTEFRVGDFRPNPFLGLTTVRFSLPGSARATLRVFDLAGRLVRTLADGELGAGEHTATWDARDDAGVRVQPGMYFARLMSGGRIALRRVLFVR